VSGNDGFLEETHFEILPPFSLRTTYPLSNFTPSWQAALRGFASASGDDDASTREWIASVGTLPAD
jgi:hypothetical protein